MTQVFLTMGLGAEVIFGKEGETNKMCLNQ